VDAPSLMLHQSPYVLVRTDWTWNLQSVPPLALPDRQIPKTAPRGGGDGKSTLVAFSSSLLIGGSRRLLSALDFGSEIVGNLLHLIIEMTLIGNMSFPADKNIILTCCDCKMLHVL
jgi:hypothetical protein